MNERKLWLVIYFVYFIKIIYVYWVLKSSKEIII